MRMEVLQLLLASQIPLKAGYLVGYKNTCIETHVQKKTSSSQMGSSSHKFSESQTTNHDRNRLYENLQVLFPHQATARIFRRHSGQSAFWPVRWLGAVGPGKPGLKPGQNNNRNMLVKPNWYPKQPVFHGSLVISNHFLYKDLVHPPIETTIYKQMFQVPARVHQQKKTTLPETNTSPLKIRYPKTKNHL